MQAESCYNSILFNPKEWDIVLLHARAVGFQYKISSPDPLRKTFQFRVSIFPILWFQHSTGIFGILFDSSLLDNDHKTTPVTFHLQLAEIRHLNHVQDKEEMTRSQLKLYLRSEKRMPCWTFNSLLLLLSDLYSVQGFRHARNRSCR